MKQHIIILFFVCTAFLGACSSSDEYRLSSSVFIEDPDFPGLPIYSELGYNTFGMYIDRRLFVSDESLMPVKVITKPDTCRIEFTGRYGNAASSREDAALTFHLPGYVPENIFALLSLNGKTYSLTDTPCKVTFAYERKTDTLRIIEGSLTFKRVQKLLVDKEEVKSVLSGTFSIKGEIADKPVFIGNGRFDVSVGENNFFKNNRKSAKF